MNLLLYKQFTKHAILRAVFLGGIGITLLIFPEFLLEGVFYVIAGYMILYSVLRIMDFILENGAKHLFSYGRLIIAILIIVFGLYSIAFSRYLIHISPVYLGSLLLIEAMVYFVITSCVTIFWKKVILIILSSIAFLGGIAVVIFTFGFGIGGILGLARVSGFASLFSCLYTITAYLIYQEPKN
ncbi:hypothetical protein NYR90_16775 [Clostridioides difficile]|nr:hypothetical protein NYR90_16775 [Clostridioides difficile]